MSSIEITLPKCESGTESPMIRGHRAPPPPPSKQSQISSSNEQKPVSAECMCNLFLC